jgi:hypothetical protein
MLLERVSNVAVHGEKVAPENPGIETAQRLATPGTALKLNESLPDPGTPCPRRNTGFHAEPTALKHIARPGVFGHGENTTGMPPP